MSADNGYVIRKNKAGKFVLQMYFASFDDYPDVEDPSEPVFDTLEEAVMRFAEWETDPWFVCEYGLSVKILPQKTWEEGDCQACLIQSSTIEGNSATPHTCSLYSERLG